MNQRYWTIGFIALVLSSGVNASSEQADGSTAYGNDKAFRGDPVAAYFQNSLKKMGGLAMAQQKALGQTDHLARKCAVCHGEDGTSSAPMKKVVVPNIAAQQPLYLFRQLWNLRSGERNHPVMAVMAEGMSDDDLLALSLRFSALPLPPSQGMAIGGHSARGKDIYNELCIHCHGEDGMGISGIPRLKGQNPTYLVNTLTSFRDGGRFRSHAGMAAISAKLQDEDIASIAAFLADFSN